MFKTKNNKLVIVLGIVIIFILAYFFVYKPYFTVEGKIWREVKEEKMLEEKVLYYVCRLPNEHRYHRMFMKECDELKKREQYESEHHDCTPDYMGSCN